ncbi:hypothetical protein HXX76_002335 [Chlamydomonas incerta]|uniref:Uncharacterized protein n=1 Tax=Chlamydomonas incerta TaxID=51695 RepID=A0A835SNF8_CHLIN|nr:hypothetical protein HXX76_002335 [Chlamydomonas incerta]|eukprot:KAG2423111.1 hypothetical protein HXX76_002335 [Chlamydomonas incerta]
MAFAVKSMRAASGLRPTNTRRTKLVCKAEAETTKTPEWVPAEAAPVLKFLESTDVKLEELPAYKTYLQPYVESDLFKSSTGWKELPETINGRAAMLGFVAAAGAEIFGSGSVLTQLSAAPQAVLVVLGLIVASSAVPVVKGTQGDYLSALKDTYSVPQGVFTAANEKVHGRLAMLGLTTLILIEMIVGRALL